MATRYYTGAAKEVAQVNTATPANVLATNTFTLTCNGKTLVYTAVGTTVAEVTAGLVALVAASEEPEWQEVTATDSTTHVTLTARTPGKPFTQTSSAAGGTATLITATTTANSGPEQYDLAANWSAATAPVNGDTVIIEGAFNLKYGTLASVTAARTIIRDFSGTMGLPPVNADGGYPEYRSQYFLMSSTILDVMENVSSGMIRLNVGSAQTTATIYSTGGATVPTLNALTLLGTHASNALNHLSGSVGVATEAGEAATIATVKTGSGGFAGQLELTLGIGCTLTNGIMSGGSVKVYADVGGYLYVKGGTVTLIDDPDIAAAVIVYQDGTLVINGTPTIGGAVEVYGRVDCTQDVRQFTCSGTVTLHRGSTWDDRYARGTYSDDVLLDGCDWADVTARFGAGHTYTIA
jgi:trimeric autotransporter adhesin